MLKDNSKLSIRDWKQIAYTLENILPFETCFDTSAIVPFI